MSDKALDTFPKLLRRNAELLADKPAIREKDFGIWQTWTWSQMQSEIRLFAAGLAARGFKRGDTLAIIGDNRPRLYWGIAAAQCLGGVPVPAYQDAAAEEFQFLLEHAAARFVLAEDQEQVDKVLEVQDRCPMLEEVVYDDARGLRNYDHTRMHDFDSIQKEGLRFLEKHPFAVASVAAVLLIVVSGLAMNQIKEYLLAEEAHVVDDYGVVLQEVDPEFARPCGDGLARRVDLVVIEFVIAGHVDHRRVEFRQPLEPFGADADVARGDHHVTGDRRHR